MVELLILLTFGAEPDAEAAAGGLVAESTDWTGTEDGTTVGNGDGFGAGECCESDNRSAICQHRRVLVLTCSTHRTRERACRLRPCRADRAGEMKGGATPSSWLTPGT